MQHAKRERLRIRDFETPHDSLALKRFGNFSPETESKQFEASKTSSFVDRAVSIWRTIDLSHYDTEDRYNACMRRVRGIHATSEDLATLLVALTQFQDETDFLDKAGFFISALMNCGKEPKYSLDLTMLQYGPINSLGYMNNKVVEIFGDVGNNAGEMMRKGILTIYGDAEDRTAFQSQGGKIHVMGNVEDMPGFHLIGGDLIIEESAGTMVGYLMSGGTIHVKGNVYGAFGNEMDGGKIVIDGKVSARIRSGKEIIVLRVCDKMTGGEVHMNDNYISPRGIKGGKVFHKEVLMWPDARIPEASPKNHE